MSLDPRNENENENENESRTGEHVGTALWDWRASPLRMASAMASALRRLNAPPSVLNFAYTGPEFFHMPIALKFAIQEGNGHECDCSY